MFTDRFEPIDADGLNKKAENLSSKDDELVGLLDDRDDQANEGNSHGGAGQNDQADTSPAWTSRIAKVLPVVRALRDTDGQE